MSRGVSVLATIGLGVAGVAGLLMSLCGGLISVTALFNLRDPYSEGFMVVSVPSLLVGLLVLWLVVRALRKRAARRAAAALRTIEPEPSDDEPAAK